MAKTLKVMLPITNIEPHQVFVFGSNDKGIHGSGSAGTAMMGHTRNWRGDETYGRAISSPPGSHLRVGHLAVYGEGRGYQEGKNGSSYAISTIAEPGALPKTPEEKSSRLRDIYKQIVEMIKFANQNKDREFLITAIGTKRAGFTEDEMQLVWDTVESRHGFPENFTFVKLAISDI